MKSNLITVIINNMPIKVPNTFTVLQACEQASVEVPRFCYHEKLSVAGNCRMCLVEIVKSPKPVVSCAMPVMENMEIFTNTPLVKKAREAILEFLLINHPLDCPICDQGGECDLQDQTLSYGSDRSRFYEHKRGVEDKECGPIIKTIMTRCIHCTRCIRFSAEISGQEELGIIGRGNQTEIGTYVQSFIKSELSGNLVDLCPVGALTSKPYAFLSRNWELTKRDSIDFLDAVCSNINIQTRQSSIPHKKAVKKNNFYPKDTIIRILPRRNDFINETWISNKTRYAFDGALQNRIENPKLFYNNKIQNCNWEELLSYIYIILNFNIPSKFYLNKYKKINGITGDLSDIKSIYYFFQFLNNLGSNNIQNNNDLLSLNVDIPLFYKFNSTIAGIENSDVFLLVGVNPRYEASLINTRLRKQFLKEDIKIGLIGNPVDLTYPYDHLGCSTKTLIEITEGRHPYCKFLRKAKNPMVIFGTEFLKRKDSNALINLHKYLGKYSILQLNNYNGFNLLHSNVGQINSFELGAIPGTRSTLYINDIKKKQSDILYLLESNDIDSKKWISKNNNNEQITKVIVQNSHQFSSNFNVDITVPTTTIFERSSLLMNTEGRTQQTSRVVTPYSTSKNTTKIFKGLSILFKLNNKDNFSIEQLYKENPTLTNINNISKNFNIKFMDLCNFSSKIYLSSYLPLVNNFYMTDIISKNSQVMSECSLLLNKKTNFLKKTKIT